MSALLLLPPVIPIRQLKRYGGPAPTRAYQLVKDGVLPARKQGRHTVVLAEDFARYLDRLPVVEARP